MHSFVDHSLVFLLPLLCCMHLCYVSDLNECAEDVSECSCSNPEFCTFTCHNNDGSYSCSCSAGYEIDTDKKTCIG